MHGLAKDGMIKEKAFPRSGTAIKNVYIKVKKIRLYIKTWILNTLKY